MPYFCYGFLDILVFEKINVFKWLIFKLPPSPSEILFISHYCTPFPPDIYFYTCGMEGGCSSEQFGTNLVLLDQKLASQEQF